MAETLPEPKSRKEQYLAKAAGMDTQIPAEPMSREEEYLNAIAQGGGGGGTSNFNDLENRPQLNGTAMTGNTNITNFTGTDGVNAGAQGLVPAPATTDNGSLLKADGTWGSEIWFKNQYNIPGVKITKDSRAAGQGSITIGAEAMAQGDYSVALGNSAYTDEYANSAVAVGQGANARRTYSTAVGAGATSSDGECTALGVSASASGSCSTAIGAYSTASSDGAISFAYCYDGGDGVVNFGPFNTSFGYNNTNYRLLTGVHDAQNAHDAVTLGQLNTLLSALDARITALEGGSAPSPTYPYTSGSRTYYLYNGVEVYVDQTDASQNLYYASNNTIAIPGGEWSDNGDGIVSYIGGGSEEPGPDEPVAPDEPAPEDTEAPAEG